MNTQLIRSLRYLLLLPLLALSTVAEAVLIDDFEAGSIVVNATGIDVVQVSQGPAIPGVVGGERHFEVGRFGGSEQTISVDAELGEFKFETGDTAGYFTLTYGSEGSPLNLDLLADGSNAFAIDYPGDMTTSPLSYFSVRSAEGNGYLRLNGSMANSSLLPNGTRRATLSFSDFVFDRGSSSIDWQNIEEIELYGSRFVRNDLLIITNIMTTSVPEPGTAVLALGLVVPFLSRRTKRFSANVKSL